jgi:hypothetical protein
MRLLQLVGWGMLGVVELLHFLIRDGSFAAIPTRTVVFSPFKSVSFFLNFLQGITILFLLVHSAFFLDRGESLNNGILVNEGLVVSR